MAYTDEPLEVVCCAEAYPEPSLLINNIPTSIVNKTQEDPSNIIKVCGAANVTTPRQHSNFTVTCEAIPAAYNCSPPADAMGFCEATRHPVNVTVSVTSNGKFTAVDNQVFQISCAILQNFKCFFSPCSSSNPGNSYKGVIYTLEISIEE